MNHSFAPPSDTRGPCMAELSMSGVDTLLPMAVRITKHGHIAHIGPTLAKLPFADGLIGTRFLEAFELLRPRNVNDLAGVLDTAGETLKLQARQVAGQVFRGIGVKLADGGMLINLSFGLGAMRAVGDGNLSSNDFAPTDLTVEVLYLVEANSLVQRELHRYNEQLYGQMSAAEARALTDTLTGIGNRRALDAALQRYRRSDDHYAIMNVDLDHFKEVNDTHGHAAGDTVLCHVAEALSAEIRSTDTLARVGGDEFIFLFAGDLEQAYLASIAGRIYRRLNEPIPFGAEALTISCSIGIASSARYDAPETSQVIKDADEALYRAKAAGRGGFVFFEEEAAGAED